MILNQEGQGCLSPNCNQLTLYIGNNILQNIPIADYERFIELLKTAILSTDLSVYFSKRASYFVSFLFIYNKLVTRGGRNSKSVWQELKILIY